MTTMKKEYNLDIISVGNALDEYRECVGIPLYITMSKSLWVSLWLPTAFGFNAENINAADDGTRLFRGVPVHTINHKDNYKKFHIMNEESDLFEELV